MRDCVVGDVPVCLRDSHRRYRAEKNVRCRKHRGDKCPVSQAGHVGRHIHLVLHKAGACAEPGEAHMSCFCASCDSRSSAGGLHAVFIEEDSFEHELHWARGSTESRAHVSHVSSKIRRVSRCR